MSSNNHQVTTKDYPENLHGGIMICGINYGYSNEDEKNESKSSIQAPDPKSFFSDASVNQSKFKLRLLLWLSSWGLELNTEKGKEGPFERSFFQTNWLDTQTRSVTSNEPITLDMLVKESAGILSLIEKRKPCVIILIGAKLIDAFNDISIRDKLVKSMGHRSGNAEARTADLPGYQGRKFKMYLQKFGETKVVCLPHPQSRGLTNDYVKALNPATFIINHFKNKS